MSPDKYFALMVSEIVPPPLHSEIQASLASAVLTAYRQYSGETAGHTAGGLTHARYAQE